MASELSMQYEQMQQSIDKLKNLSKTFDSTTKEMTTNVNTLCENWKAQASPVYKGDYEKLTKNFGKTLQVVNKLIESTQKYIKDMQALDQAYSKSKVQ